MINTYNRIIKASLILVLLICIKPGASFASIDDDVAEMSGRVGNIKSLNKKQQGTWLPVPIPISNPTIGSGLQLALLYLHPKTSADPTALNPTSGFMGMYTDSNSWFTGGFHDGNWKDDLYRFRVLAGSGKFNLDFFGIGNNSGLEENPIPYSIASDVIFSQLLRRIPGSKDWYLGVRYAGTRSSVTFDKEVNPELPTVTGNAITSSLAMLSNYDSRDNNYYPAQGSYFEFVWALNDEAIGSDFNFKKLNAFYSHYLSFSKNAVVALQTRLDDANGDVPFYLLPTLRLRGFPAGRYKDNSMISGHLEWRHKPIARWGYVVFFEAGNVADTIENIFQTETIIAYGGGVRRQVTQDKKLNLGLDIGISGGDSAIYVNIGERF